MLHIEIINKIIPLFVLKIAYFKKKYYGITVIVKNTAC